MALSGNNSNLSWLDIYSGTVRLDGDNALSTSTAVSFWNGGTLNVNGRNVAAGKFYSRSGQTTGTVLLGSGTLAVGGSDVAAEQTFVGTISGTGSLVKQGAGKQTFSATLTYTGQTTAIAGTIEFLSPIVSTWVESGGSVIGQGSLRFMDSSMFTQVHDAYVDDGMIDRGEMITILTSAGSGNVVTQNEFTDLTTIVDNPFRLQMVGYWSGLYVEPGYVDILATNVVRGNVANAHYQGSTLGNLAAGDSAAKLNNLVNKWLKGLDHPAAANGYASYKTASGSLFVDGPSVNDMDQGGVGDCYLIATLGAIADTDASSIQNMFIDNGDNTWTVRFFYNVWRKLCDRLRDG